MAAEEALELNCPICLDHISNIAYLDCCDHTFCVHCIQEWTNIQAHCPVCRQLISFIFHSLEETVLEEFMTSFDSRTPSMWFLFIVPEEQNQSNEQEDTADLSEQTVTGGLPLLDDQLELDQREDVSMEEGEHVIASDAEPTAAQMQEDPASDSEVQHIQSPIITDSRWRERSTRRSQSSSQSHSCSRSRSRSRSPSRPHN